jgi:hypothetical protein
LAGSTGTAGYLMQSNGASAPTWVAQSTITAGSASTATTATNANNVAIVDDTTTATTVYPTWSNGTTGNQALETSSTKLSFNPSTGRLTATSYAGDGSALTGVGAFASGTRLLFQQTAAPTGWTKDTTYNNYALRVVSGTAGTGGSVAFTTAFASQAVSGTVGTSGATTLSSAQIPQHTHTLIGYQVLGGGGSPQYSASQTNSAGFATDGGTGGGGSHDHAGGTFTGTAINLAVQYVDTIIASKD